MMDVLFEPMTESHRKDVVNIYNHYIRTSFAAYPDEPVPYAFYDRFIEMTSGYPAYVILQGGHLAGFCFLRPFKPVATFSACAEITYFIDKGHTGKGLGSAALQKLETDGRAMGIRILLASIASENEGSIRFHLGRGFVRCGNFQGIIKKFDKQYDMIWMQKTIG